MVKLLRLCLAIAPIALVVLPLRAAGAQVSAAPTAPIKSSAGKGQVLGVVVDSLKGGYLSGADVVLEGGRAATGTDSVGRFRIDSLAPGTYQVGVFHTRLDTLGIRLVTQPIRVAADSTSIVLLAVPSPMTLIRRSCQIQSGPYGESAVVGRVIDPESLEPVSGAEVSIAWIEIEVSKESGLRRNPFVRRDSTDASGAFSLCGLPSSMQATLQARHGSAMTGEVPISLGDRPVELLARTLLLSPTTSSEHSGNAAVTGTVTLESSPTNAGARVEVVGTGIAATTNEKGEFSLRKLPSGSRILVIRHVGFTEEIVAVDLSSREEKQVTVNLSRFVDVMDPVLVKARRTVGLEKVGFNQRRKTGLGFYIGPERLVGAHPLVLSDILRLVPGLRVEYGEHGDMVSTARGITNGCVQYYLDDSPYLESTHGDVNRFVRASDVRAVEVYQGLGTPAQFDRPGASCTTIVIWTRWKLRG